MSTPDISPPSALQAGLSETGSGIGVVDEAVAALLALPIPTSSSIETLAGDVDAARTDAASWTSTVRPRVISTLQGVIDWSSTFDGLYDQLVPLAEQLAAGDESAVAPFQSLLGQLQDATEAEASTAAGVADQLVAFIETIDADIAALGGDQSSLEAEQSAYEAQAKAADMAADAVEQQLAELQWKVIEMVAEGHYVSAELTMMINELTGRKEDLRQSEQESESAAAAAEGQAGAVGESIQSVQSYSASLGAIGAGVGALDTGWNTLNSNFTVLLEGEDISSYDAFTPALLESVKLDWDNLAAQARSMLGAL